ncbi:DUF1302 domain-containing protein [Dechloromonas denitrificans]|uniref:DUF1302 domain-containing protein n=1 Tax=Dechloromonas denitrificans TaxID=281362 RepID=UPI001CF9BAE1|nr:DUF1302 domain-containing protein [Dechloromonas denitrificans]UCV07048.1 DUF1302 domain-containing protein [Dechloromonas denitrificans]
MQYSKKNYHRHARSTIPWMAGALFSAHALGFQTELEDGTKIISTTNISYGSQWRAASPLKELIGPAYGGVSGSSANDDGNLNYKKGDQVSSVVKLVSDLEVKKDNYGALVRAKAWYDMNWENHTVPHGSSVNQYAGGALSDQGFVNEAQFSGVSLLDAYAYGNFRLNNSDLTLRVGKQVLNWGESTFFQGLNQTSPLDIPALRRPGAQVKEGLIPVETAYFSWAPRDQPLSIEGFYEWKFRPFVVDGCGTFFSTSDIGVDNSCGASANLGPAIAFPDGSVGYMQRGSNRKAKDSGQYGFATHYNIESVDTQVGLYAMNLHSGIPIFSSYTSSPTHGMAQLQYLKYMFEYPEDVRRYGATIATNIPGGWSLGMELSHTPNQPVQVSAVDMFYAAVGSGLGPLGSKYAGAADGTYMRGYDRVAQTQFLVNTLKLLSPMWGATGGMFIAEFAYQHASIDDPDQPGATRYGRSFNYGANLAPICPSTVPGQCSNDGYATKNAYGYRLYGQLNYTTDIGVSVKPGIYFAHDLKGWSVDGQLNEKRRMLGLSLRFERAAYWAEASYVGYNRNATYDDGRDRAFYGFSLGYTF